MIWLPALIARTVRSSVAWGVDGTKGLVGGIIGGAIALAVTVPVVLLALLILVPAMMLVALLLGLAGWPFGPRPQPRYLDWEHWEDE
ncbi:MAG: hypothetical protein XD60_0032 [Acetothermia bacterium 64_32]|nr:MAG: hypothetical protein XD60_0032 [Acetothermia bacterium 64_32]